MPGSPVGCSIMVAVFVSRRASHEPRLDPSAVWSLVRVRTKPCTSCIYTIGVDNKL